LYHNYEKKKIKPSLSEIVEILLCAVLNFSKIFIVLDALDECTKALMTLLQEIRNLQPKLHLMVAGRPDVKNRMLKVFPVYETLEIRVMATQSDPEKLPRQIIK
jgi:hypothetical protein